MLGFLEAGYGNILLAVLCFLGMAGTWMAGRRYRRLTIQTDNMSGTQSKYLKQIKNKFETSYRMNQGVNNVGLFVERNVQEFRFLGIRLQNLGNTAAAAGSLAFLLGSAAALFCYGAGAAVQTVIYNLAASLLLAAAALVYWKNADVEQKEENFCVHIQDYLENVLANRLAATSPRDGAAEDKSREFAVRETVTKEPDAAVSGTEEWGSAPARAEFRREDDGVPESHKEEIAYLKQSLDRIASGREPQRESGEPKRKHSRFSPEEQSLIEDILREYFA